MSQKAYALFKLAPPFFRLGIHPCFTPLKHWKNMRYPPPLHKVNTIFTPISLHCVLNLPSHNKEHVQEDCKIGNLLYMSIILASLINFGKLWYCYK